MNVVLSVQTGPLLHTSIENSCRSASTPIWPVIVASLTLLATLFLLYYGWRLHIWTRIQLYSRLICIDAQGVWYKIQPGRIEVKLRFVNPGASLIHVESCILTKWNGNEVEALSNWNIPVEDRFVTIGVPIVPHENWETTIVIPFSNLPSSPVWENVKSSLRDVGVRIAVEIRYMTGPAGSKKRKLTLCFMLWGVSAAADGALLGVHQVACKKVKGG